MSRKPRSTFEPGDFRYGEPIDDDGRFRIDGHPNLSSSRQDVSSASPMQHPARQKKEGEAEAQTADPRARLEGHRIKFQLDGMPAGFQCHGHKGMIGDLDMGWLPVHPGDPIGIVWHTHKE